MTPVPSLLEARPERAQHDQIVPLATVLELPGTEACERSMAAVLPALRVRERRRGFPRCSALLGLCRALGSRLEQPLPVARWRPALLMLVAQLMAFARPGVEVMRVEVVGAAVVLPGTPAAVRRVAVFAPLAPAARP